MTQNLIQPPRRGFSRIIEKDQRTERVIGAVIVVHRTLGPHFQELTYQRALVCEFGVAGLDFGREVHIPIFYRGKRLHTRRVDLLLKM